MATKTKRTAPKPRTIPKRPVKVCAGGHRQGAKWKASDPCWQCDQAERQRALTDPAYARAQREAAAAELGPIPEEMTMRCGDGSVITYRIPRGLRRAGRRARR